jgi:glycosyltransferase involved in cell wall biosynthesis
MQLKIEGKRLICFLGRINHEKRSDRAVDIIRSLVQDKINLHLFIFGDGEDIDKLKSLICERKLEQYVTILGFIKKAASYLKIFDLLLLTSDREGMPFVLWEALGNGVPVVSSDVGGVKEIIEKYNCGYVFEKENLNDAVSKISTILNDENLRKEMGNNGLSITRDQFNSKNFISTIENSYYSLVK